MKIRGSTQELLTWLNNRDVIVSKRTLRRRLKLWQEEPAPSDSEQLINLINHLFHTQPTYSDDLISRRLKEDYNLQPTARHVKTIRLRHSWLRRNNDCEVNQAQQAKTTTSFTSYFKKVKLDSTAVATSSHVLHASTVIERRVDMCVKPSRSSITIIWHCASSAATVELRIVFIGALAVAEWTTDKEVSYEPIKEFVKVTFAASEKLELYAILLEIPSSSSPHPQPNSQSRAGEGRWTIAANHIHDPTSKKPSKALLWLSEWHERRTVASIIHTEGWETAKDQDLRNLPATSYPITICWVPLPDQSHDGLPRTGREETAFTIDGEVFTLNQRRPSLPPSLPPSPPVRQEIGYSWRTIHLFRRRDHVRSVSGLNVTAVTYP